MNDLKNQIINNVNKTSSLFASLASMTMLLNDRGTEGSTITGDNLELLTNIQSLKELQDELIEKITNDVIQLAAMKQE
jgi:hypothetical protein